MSGDRADWIFFQLQKFLRLPWQVPERHQPGSLAGLIVDPGAGINFVLVPYHPAGQARSTT